MTTAVAQPTFFAARPGIRVDGRLDPALGGEMLQSLLVEETTAGLFRCEARFLNWGPTGDGEGLLLFDGATVHFGKVLSVELGPPDAGGPVFAGRITGIEAHYPTGRPPELVILAEDRFQDLRLTRRTRSFENKKDEDVFRAIASANGLTPQLDLDGPTYRVLAQVNQSDLAFLRERAAAIDAEVWVDGNALYVQLRSRRSAGSVRFVYGQNLLEFSVLADLAHQRSSVRVCGWDVAGKRAIDEQAGESAVTSELRGGMSGGAVLDRAFSPSVHDERIVSAVPLSKDEAKRLAEARYRERARRFVRGTGVVDGNTRIRVGATVELAGLGPWFDGSYYVTAARHTFDLRHGFRTEFDCERPGIAGDQ
jgi:phage protein D